MKATSLHFLISIFVVFLFVNSFYIYPPINSSIVGVLVVFVFAAFYRHTFLTTTYKMIIHKKVLSLYVALSVMFFISLVIPILHETLDLSYSKNFISQYVQLTLMIFCFSFVFHDFKNKKDSPSEVAEKLIVWSFVFQSVVQILAFLFPPIASFVHFFYTEASQSIYNGYDGVRGLALTSSPGWGLTVGYGLSFLFFVKAYIVNKKITLLIIFLGLLLVLGTFFAGRSGFLGAILGAGFYLVASERMFAKIKGIIYILFLFSIVCVLVYFLLPSFVLTLQERVFPFVFEFLYQYESSGVLQTRSTDILIEMWSIEIPNITYFWGTGLFSDPDTGKYYMGTDVGYLRNVLFGGGIWCCLLCIYQAKLLNFSFVGLYKLPPNSQKLLFFIFLYLLILEAKAMTIGFNKYMFSICVFYSLSLIYEHDFEKKVG